MNPAAGRVFYARIPCVVAEPRPTRYNPAFMTLSL